MVYTLDYLHENHQEPTIHERNNIQSLNMLLIYSVIFNNLSPQLVVDSFREEKTKYSLRSKSTLQ